MNTSSVARIFSIADRKFPSQPTGGPAGVNLRLYLANEKYHILKNIYYIFDGKVLSHTGVKEYEYDASNPVHTDELSRFFLLLDQEYEFTNNDIFIFHDVVSSFVFLNFFTTTNTVLVYHQQGSLYREWEYFTGMEDSQYKLEQDALQIMAFMKVSYIAFPSFGAKDSLIASEPMMAPFLKKKGLAILYNGFDNPGNINASSQISIDTIIQLDHFSGLKFITVAALNVAKGVERIPQFLASLKKKNIDFKWIVVGNGVTAKRLLKQIDMYELNDAVIWLRDRLPHDDILSILQHTDFYILTHRFSIFDFATIEAMSYGNIPVLTPVGGNFEFIQDDNGVLLNQLDSCDEFLRFIEGKSLDELKKKNAFIANRNFSEKAFLEGYAELVNEFSS